MNAQLDSQHSKHRKALAYVRISDAKQQSKGDGIHSQESAIREYARYKGMRVERVFRDVISGKFAERPAMEEMLVFLKANRHENYAVIIDDISRLARNIVAHIELRDEIRRAGGELMSPSHEFSDDPTRQMPEKIIAIVKEQERIDNAARVLSRSRARMKNGYYVFSAPCGFKYSKDKSGRGGKVLVFDEPLASIVKDTLEKFASGVLGSQIEVRRYLEQNPAFPKGKSGRIGNSRVKKMLTTPIYAGYIEHEPWGLPLTQAQHTPLISFGTYLKIQDRLNGNVKPQAVRLDINPEFPLRGLVNCDTCSLPLTAGKSKGRSRYYSYYVCHTKGCEAYGKSIKKDKLENDFEALLKQLKPSGAILNVATQMFKTIWEKHHASFKERQVAAQNRLSGVEKKIDNIVSRIVATTQPVLITAYETELSKFEQQRIAISEQIEHLRGENGVRMPDFEQAYRTAMTFLANPCFLWRSSHISHKRAAAKLCFGGHLSYDRIEGYRTAKKTLPFQLFQQLNSNQKEKNMQNERMVEPSGVEPLTSCMPCKRSTN